MLPWFLTRRFRVALLVLFVVVATAQGVVSVFFRTNDVALHYSSGHRLANPVERQGSWYYSHIPYPAGRVVLNATLAWLPYYPFRAACYVLALAALAGTFVLWERMAASRRAVAGGVPFASAAFAVLLLSPWVLRDLDDCGLQIFLLFLLTGCFYLWDRGRTAGAGGWLGVAVVYKATPVLLVPVALLTGRWRAAVVAGAVAVVLCAAPALFAGWDVAAGLNSEFVCVADRGGRVADPTENGYEPPRHQNQGLVMSLARVLRSHPPDHPLYLDHPLFVQFLDLPPAIAAAVAKGLVLALVLALGVRVGRKVYRDGRDADLLTEWAVLCVLCALLSPVCWLQHLVLCLPAAYLVMRDGAARCADGGRPLRRNVAGVAAVAVLVFGFARFALGRELSIVFLSYKVNTLAALTLMGLVLALPGRVRNPDRRTPTGVATPAPRRVGVVSVLPGRRGARR